MFRTVSLLFCISGFLLFERVFTKPADLNNEVHALQINPSTQVECFTDQNCKDSGVTMTLEDCCVNTDKIRFFKTQDTCEQCIVYGWLDNSVVMEERYQPYTLEVGYIKGTGPSMDFNVIVEQGTTRHKADYTVSPQQITINGNTAPAKIEVNTFLDGVALEPDETLTLRLEVVHTECATGYFRDTLPVRIVDTDALKVSMAMSEYRASEAEEKMTIIVKKNRRIATPLSVAITPLTIAQAMTRSDITLPTVPADSDHNSPNRAMAGQDFDDKVLTVEFPVDEDAPVNDLHVSVNITNDAINEAAEQYFMVTLDIGQDDKDKPLVQLKEPQASLCKIVDDDPIRIGFTQPSYTINRSEYEFWYNNVAAIAKEDDRVTEQTFFVIVEAVAASPDPSIPVASESLLHSILSFTASREAVYYIDPSDQQIFAHLNFLHEIVNTEPESFAFELVISSDIAPFFLPAKNLYQSTYVIVHPPSKK